MGVLRGIEHLSKTIPIFAKLLYINGLLQCERVLHTNRRSILSGKRWFVRIAIATLLKNKTRDGLVELWEFATPGQTYKVDLDSRQVAEGYSARHDREWKREVIVVVSTGEWLPTELLDIDEEDDTDDIRKTWN